MNDEMGIFSHGWDNCLNKSFSFHATIIDFMNPIDYLQIY